MNDGFDQRLQIALHAVGFIGNTLIYSALINDFIENRRLFSLQCLACMGMADYLFSRVKASSLNTGADIVYLGLFYLLVISLWVNGLVTAYQKVAKSAFNRCCDVYSECLQRIRSSFLNNAAHFSIVPSLAGFFYPGDYTSDNTGGHKAGQVLFSVNDCSQTNMHVGCEQTSKLFHTVRTFPSSFWANLKAIFISTCLSLANIWPNPSGFTFNAVVRLSAMPLLLIEENQTQVAPIAIILTTLIFMLLGSKLSPSAVQKTYEYGTALHNRLFYRPIAKAVLSEQPSSLSSGSLELTG